MKFIIQWLRLLILLLMTTLFSTQLYATTYTSSWGTAPWTWPNGSLNETITIAPTLNANFNITFNGAGGTAPRSFGGVTTPAIDDASQITQFGGIPDLGIIYNDPASVTLVLTFNKPVYNASFLISDIDNSGARVDQVVVTTDVGDPTLVNINTGAGDTIASIVGNTASSSSTSGAQTNNDLGSVRVNIPDGATTVTINYNEIGTSSTRGIGVFGSISFSDGGSVSGHLYNDLNGNGVQDGTDTNMVNVDVVITDAKGNIKTVSTDANGDYQADELAPGVASVNIDEADLDFPTGATQTEGTDATNVTVVVDTNTFEQNNGFQIQADLVTTKIVDNATPSVGDTVTFTLSVTNNGGAQATNVSLTDTLPIGMNYTSSNPSQGSYANSTGLWTIGTLNNGSSATLTISGTVDAGTEGGTLTNTTTAASTPDQTDPSTVGDDLNESITVNPIGVPAGSCYASTWGTAPWTWTTAVDNDTIVISPDLSLTVDVSTAASGNLDALGGTQIDSIYLGGVDDLAVFFDPASGQGSSPVTITLTFSKPVFNTSFLITDIDSAAIGDRVDKVTVTSDVGTPTLQTVTTSTPTFSISSNTVASQNVTLARSDNNNAGTASVVVPDGATTVTIVYEENSGLTDPQTRGIGILGNLGVCIGGEIKGSVKDDVGATLGGVTVTLKDTLGNTVATTTTLGDGTYTFSNVAPGDYTVVETNLPNYASISDGDSTNTNDDTVNANTNDDSIPVSVIAGEVDDGNDFIDKQLNPPTAVDDTEVNPNPATPANPTTLTTVSNDTDPEGDINASTVNITTAGA
ncbi:MAG TPA: DUF11 domain-containing protein, partial [Epsilonproteobacteria bacterium]|nr:DUF11 domain-containing protein [Campylobacterota bacterium]